MDYRKTTFLSEVELIHLATGFVLEYEDFDNIPFKEYVRISLNFILEDQKTDFFTVEIHNEVYVWDTEELSEWITVNYSKYL